MSVSAVWLVPLSHWERGGPAKREGEGELFHGTAKRDDCESWPDPSKKPLALTLPSLDGDGSLPLPVGEGKCAGGTKGIELRLNREQVGLLKWREYGRE